MLIDGQDCCVYSIVCWVRYSDHYVVGHTLPYASMAKQVSCFQLHSNPNTVFAYICTASTETRRYFNNHVHFFMLSDRITVSWFIVLCPLWALDMIPIVGFLACALLWLKQRSLISRQRLFVSVTVLLFSSVPIILEVRNLIQLQYIQLFV